ncbi:helix-turn-helix domain-containing protein [Variovorax sp. VNK109]|jgi:hypothetical protein|uniref:helix-turn-helix domain-containing protein n=1 Tax=Variovorax sp. VNK109 TaxID=3400919 RepID=UPI003C10E4B5
MTDTLSTTHVELATALEAQRLRLRRSRGDLVSSTGLSYQSLQKILEGTSDFKVSNLLAIAQALDMDVALVPRGLAPALQAQPSHAAASTTPAATVVATAAAPSLVGAALERLRPLEPGTPRGEKP